MSDKNIIDLFLNPKSVAVIGASKNLTKGGHRIVNNLILNNFKGKIYPVNPNSDGELFGLPFKKSVLEVEDEIDIAIFYVPNRIIPDLLQECIEKGVKGAIIEASGFEEVGDQGLLLKDQILKITDNFSKIRIVGPNCTGLTKIDGDSNNKRGEKGGFFSSFVVFTKYKRGNIAIITQSGMLNGGYLMSIMEQYPSLGIRYSCAIGNKMDLNEIDFLKYFIVDPSVNIIAIYLESFKDPRKFIKLCQKVKEIPNKTIILVKGGLTSQGQKASQSHTGALAENSQLINAVIKQSGIIQAKSFHDLFQFANTFSMVYHTNKILPKEGDVSLVVGSGGAGTISADLTVQYGLKFPILSEKTYQILKNFFPDWMPPNKFALVDIWPTMEKAMMNGINSEIVLNKIYQALLDDSNIEGVFSMMFCSSRFRNMSNFDKSIETFNQMSRKPLFFYLVGDLREVKRISLLLSKYNIPNFLSIEEMIKNFSILVQESKNKSKN
ncbi:MAG: CoA-binding protein [Promethearchaeota archaeon]